MHILKKRFVIPVVVSLALFLGAAFVRAKDDFFEIAKQIEIFTTLYKAVNMNYVDEVNPAELMDKAIKNMLADLDPYTVYFNEQDVVKFKINNTGEYTGIGAMITRKEGILVIKEAYKDYPADKAGLRAGDEIIQIGDVKLKGFKEDAGQLLRGAKGAKFDLVYLRQGKTYEAKITLDEVELKAVPFYAKIDEKTGYIVLSQFNKKATLETKEAFEQLKREGCERMVLDLRGNPGGLLQEAVNICNLFVPKNEVIVTTKSKIDKHNSTYKTSREPLDTAMPLAILVDGKSASASEIVAGALQDLDRAVIIGSRSFGKGLVQRPVDLSYGTQLKVTISRYYTPSGRCIQALDYSQKTENGKGQRVDASKYNAFKTRNGRPVFDGGGVLPDIELSETQLSAISDALVKNDVIFNFATDYYYKNPLSETQLPVISDVHFTEFKSYIKKQKLSFETETELAIRKAMDIAKKEKIDGNITKEYNQLLAAIEIGQDAQIEKSKAEIKTLLTEELIKRYRYKEGLYAYYTKNSPEIKKAIAVLENLDTYQKILKK